MLQSIRDRSTGVASKVFVAFIVLVFALFGVDSLVGTLTGTNTAISVNGVEIDELLVDSETQRKTQELVQALGGDFDISAIDPALIRESAINDLIQQELLLQSALGAGMAISSKSIDLQIASTLDFQVDGVFDGERAQILLQSLGYTPNTYRTSLEKEGMLNQIAVAYSASGFVTPFEIEQAAALSLQKRNLRYLLVPQDGLAGGITVTDEEVSQYYSENQTQFMQEEQVSIEYLVLDKNDIYSEIEVSDDAVRAAYDLQITEYESLTERRASHILLEAFNDAEYSAAQTLSQAIKDRIDAGESFEELALEFSDDVGSAEDGGDVGYTTGDNFVLEFEYALQRLEVGGVSEPVRTDFGYHLIKLTEQTDTDVETFEQLEDDLRRDIQSEEVDNLFLARSEELNNLSFESIDLNEPADIMNMSKQQTELFGRSGGIGFAANNAVISAAFSLEVLEDGLNSELIAINESVSLILRVLEHNPATLMALPDVEGEIDVILRTEKVRERVQSIGETIISNINNGQNIDGLLSSQAITWSQVDDLQRSNLSLNSEIVEQAFQVAKPIEGEVSLAGFQLSTGEYAVIELQEVIAGTVEDFNGDEAVNIANYITQQTANDDFSAFMEGIEAKATIE